MIIRASILGALVLSMIGCNRSSVDLTYELIETRAHDASSYTQGLEFVGDRMFESGGGYGESVLREVDPKTGKVLRERRLPESLFAEGLSVMHGELWLLTWQENKVLVLDSDTFEFKRSHAYEGEGWGLTNDGEFLIMSDGSSTIEYRSPKDFSVVKSFEVKDGGKSVVDLNELEYLDGDLYANVYLTNRIVRISMETGLVTGDLDLTDLAKRHPEMDELQVLNGIAHHKETGHFWVTGKNWPEIYEIKIAER